MPDTMKPTGAISLPNDFVFGQIDSTPRPEAQPAAQADRAQETILAHLPLSIHPFPFPLHLAPSLGALEKFVGSFVGNGFNTIFRPDNAVTRTPMPNPIPAGMPRDNVLELNLTSESLTFSSALGAVPNRGTDPQGDIQLNGVPYLQSIKDTITGIGIHAEPGLWMAMPKTGAPNEPATLVRMASIPHGTTINAQGVSTSAAGGPNIPEVNMTPFTIGGTQTANSIPFASQNATNANTPRLPQDLTSFINADTITPAMLTNPNSVLTAIASKQTITNTIEINISTKPGSSIFGGPPKVTVPGFGGGASNIAFLLGTANAGVPNANAIQMEATFWIETVQVKITVPQFNPGDVPVLISPEKLVPGMPVPVFQVEPTVQIKAPKQITVSYTQIQYSQKVLLNFANLSWPHISVATLVPASPIAVPAAAFN